VKADDPIILVRDYPKHHMFSKHLSDLTAEDIVRALAKNAGDMQLFELIWRNEDRPKHGGTEAGPQTQIRIRREISDLERADYLEQAFAQLREVLGNNLALIEQGNPSVSVRILDVHPAKFICDVYVDENLKDRFKFWNALGGS